MMPRTILTIVMCALHVALVLLAYAEKAGSDGLARVVVSFAIIANIVICLIANLSLIQRAYDRSTFWGCIGRLAVFVVLAVVIAYVALIADNFNARGITGGLLPAVLLAYLPAQMVCYYRKARLT